MLSVLIVIVLVVEGVLGMGRLMSEYNLWAFTISDITSWIYRLRVSCQCPSEYIVELFDS
jgi:hypothetical protein